MAANQEALNLDLAAAASGAAAQSVAATVVDIEDDDGDVLNHNPNIKGLCHHPHAKIKSSGLVIWPMF